MNHNAEPLGRPVHAAEEISPPGMDLVEAAVLAGAASTLLFSATHFVIPRLAMSTGLEPVLLWFAVGGLGVFVPLVAVGFFMLHREGALSRPRWLGDRLRFRPMARSHWLWALGGLVLVALLSGLIAVALRLLGIGKGLHPTFMTVEPLTPDRLWILAVWLPFWLLNILGEEFLWRGVVLPRQEAALGSRAWLANAVGWLLFHLAFGLSILVTLLPILFILPYVVHRTRNSWTGVVIHAGLNGPAFVAVAMGWLSTS